MAAIEQTVVAKSLYDRIMTFPIGQPGTEEQFLKRLAAENRWTLDYARRVLKEYRRFLFLIARGAGALSPSHAVDQAWHLHMLHSRNYWDDFCGAVLGRELHHDPFDGAAEHGRFLTQYQRTLDGYREVFGWTAPSDIWPPARDRLAELRGEQRADARRSAAMPAHGRRRAAGGSGGRRLLYVVVAFVAVLLFAEGFQHWLVLLIALIAGGAAASSGSHADGGGPGWEGAAESAYADGGTDPDAGNGAGTDADAAADSGAEEAEETPRRGFWSWFSDGGSGGDGGGGDGGGGGGGGGGCGGGCGGGGCGGG
jgi:hypothetical protein